MTTTLAQRIEQAMEAALRDGEESLDLHGLGLKTLPPWPAAPSRLRRLDLSGNRLKTLPPEFWQFANLEYLDLGANRLATLPPEICQLRALVSLDLSENRLTALPAELAGCVRLQDLSLFNNQFESWPEVLLALLALQHLDLARNRISALPDLSRLSALESLDLSGNRLDSVDALTNLARLIELKIDDNRIAVVPEPLRRQLQALSMRGNPLATETRERQYHLRDYVSGGYEEGRRYFDTPQRHFDFGVALAGAPAVASSLDLYYKGFSGTPMTLTLDNGARVDLSRLGRKAALQIASAAEGALLLFDPTTSASVVAANCEFAERTLDRVSSATLVSRGSGPPPGQVANTDSLEPTRVAWPHLTCPDEVMVQIPFDVEVGIAEQRDSALSGTGALIVPAANFDLQLEIIPDPGAFDVIGDRSFTLHVTTEDPYPRRLVKVVALSGSGLNERRRLGVAYSAQGVLRGYAARELVVHETAFSRAPRPASAAVAEPPIDLSPFRAAHEADLTIVMRRGDDDGGHTLIFSACSPLVNLPQAAKPPRSDLGSKPAEFAYDIVRKAGRETQPLKLLDLLAGRGKRIAAKLPPEIQDALRAVAAKAVQQGRAASVLIVSEEPYIPWELAVIEPPLMSPGCVSPFLGAQVALGRWILSGSRPPPHPNRSIDVAEQAVIVGKYEGVVGLKPLEKAEKEAEDLQKAWPPTVLVPAAFEDVRAYLHGEKRADTLHFAMHGKFDATGLQVGLILIKSRANQPDILEPDVLEAEHVRSGDLSKSAPFVFLNACQVGAAQEMLGDYAGMAEAFLYIGATAVIAPLWSIDDAEARRFALNFYTSAYTQQIPPAEILRVERARFNESAIKTTPGISSNHLAYQYFGHPRLTMMRTATLQTRGNQ